MKLKKAEENTLTAGEVAIEILDDLDCGRVPDTAFDMPFVVKVGTEYLRVSTWKIKTRKDGSKVMVITAEDSGPGRLLPAPSAWEKRPK
jgi:hypothetical protein